MTSQDLQTRKLDLILRAARLAWPSSVVVSGMPISPNLSAWEVRVNTATAVELQAVDEQLAELEARAAQWQAIDEDLERRRARAAQAAAASEDALVERVEWRRARRDETAGDAPEPDLADDGEPR